MLQKPVISIVDDDPSVREGTEDLIKAMGLIPEAFERAEDFLKPNRLYSTSCLIADVQMPNINGLELCERLSDLGFDIPTVFITAHPDDAVKMRALSAGAVCFLHKPLDLQGRRLAECVEEALNRRGGQLQP